MREGNYPGAKRRQQATEMEWRCPQHYIGSPFVQHVISLAEDYRANRLGPITDLPSALVQYLRLAVAELDEFKTFWESELMPAPSKAPHG